MIAAVEEKGKETTSTAASDCHDTPSQMSPPSWSPEGSLSLCASINDYDRESVHEHTHSRTVTSPENINPQEKEWTLRKRVARAGAPSAVRLAAMLGSHSDALPQTSSQLRPVPDDGKGQEGRDGGGGSREEGRGRQRVLEKEGEQGQPLQTLQERMSRISAPHSAKLAALLA